MIGPDARLARCYNLDDLRDAARRRLPKGVFEYVDRGAEDDVAMRANLEAFRRVKLTTRFLIDLSDRDTATLILGRRAGLPLAIAPTGFAGLCWHQGELALAKAAAAIGVPFTLCAHSTARMDDIVKLAGGRLWIQVHIWREAERSYEMIAKARDLGFEALVVTIDSALGRIREYNQRNGFATPFRPNRTALADMARHPLWLATVMLRYLLTSGMPRHVNYPDGFRLAVTRGVDELTTRNERWTWADLRRLRDRWPGKLVVKGVLSEVDAIAAVEAGADAIVVSNHGGRTLDSAAATIDVLPQVARAVQRRAEIFVDGGVRRGSDIVKSIALGAQAVLIGRPTLYGVAVAGQAGAEKALRILASEFETTLGFVGCPRPTEIGEDLVFRG